MIDLTESNPTRVGLSYPPDLLASLASEKGLVYDPQPLGLWCAREAVSSDFSRRGLNVPPDRIGLTASTSEAYALLFKLLCDAGDSVLVPQPSYPLFEHLTVLESVVARPYRLEYHGAWRIDHDHLRAAIDDGTRALLIVSPNNPTGSFLRTNDLEAVAELCASREIVLIGDEVFADYPLDEAPDATSVLAAMDGVVCSLGGLSKSAGLPQLKLGWIGFGGAADRVAEVMRAYEIVADTYLSVSSPVQIALPTMLGGGAAIRAQIQSRIARNLARLREAAARQPAISVLRVEGGWSAVLEVPAYRSEEALVLELVVEDHVLVHPGYFFDFENEAYLVVSLLVPPDVFDRGTERVLVRASRPAAGS
ncbi:MAG: pyridoxal phosphate-dependent aminotransferase [Vicinamibacterales bacterium]